MMFPIYLKDQNFVEPEDTVYYLVASNGVFLIKKQGLYTSSIEADGSILGLKRHEERVKLRLSRRVPRELVEQTVGFFLHVYRIYDTEAVVFLYYSESEDAYSVAVPKQTVKRRIIGSCVIGGGGVKYEGRPNPPGFRRIGTIHSHAEMPAFHSCQDDRDEAHDDGIHITIGSLDSRPTFSASFVVDGRRFRISPRRILAGYRKPTLPPPACWMRQIRCVTEFTRPLSTIERDDNSVTAETANNAALGATNNDNEDRTNSENENPTAH